MERRRHLDSSQRACMCIGRARRGRRERDGSRRWAGNTRTPRTPLTAVVGSSPEPAARAQPPAAGRRTNDALNDRRMHERLRVGALRFAGRIDATVTAVSVSSISLAWTQSSNGRRGGGSLLGYRVFRDGLLVDSTSSSTYTFTDLACGTSYTLGVASYRSSGYQSPVSSVTAMTAACTDTAAPSVPRNLRVVASTLTSVTIAWDASGDDREVVGYDVFNGSTTAGTTASTTYTVDGLTCGTDYPLGVDRTPRPVITPQRRRSLPQRRRALRRRRTNHQRSRGRVTGRSSRTISTRLIGVSGTITSGMTRRRTRRGRISRRWSRGCCVCRRAAPTSSVAERATTGRSTR